MSSIQSMQCKCLCNSRIEIEKQKIVELPLIVQITPRASEQPQLLIIEIRLPAQAQLNTYQSSYLPYSYMALPLTQPTPAPQSHVPPVSHSLDRVQPFRGSVDIAGPPVYSTTIGTTSAANQLTFGQLSPQSVQPLQSSQALPSLQPSPPLPVHTFSNAIQSNSIQDGFGTFAAIAAPGTSGFQQTLQPPFQNNVQPPSPPLHIGDRTQQGATFNNLLPETSSTVTTTPDPNTLDNRIQPNVLKSTVG